MSEKRFTSPPASSSWQAVANALAHGEVVGAERGQVFETHLSYVVVGERSAYKLKKPVRLSFVDYSTIERRRVMCSLEWQLNRRLAPNVYRGVGSVRRGTSGFELCEFDDPAGVEPLVMMAPVERSQTLQSRVNHMLAQPRDLEVVGRTLAAFHGEASPAPEPAGTVGRWRAWAQGVTTSLRGAPREVLQADRVEAAIAFLARWLDASEAVFAERRAAGHVRDCHGDLRLEHVAFEDKGVAILDCVEFDEKLRHHDVLADLSFLVMELQYGEREDLSRALIGSWSEAGGPLDQRLLWAYAVTRALIRVEVGLARIEQLSPGMELRLTHELTQKLLDLAIRLSWRAREPQAVVFAGLSGSGKSTIARILADRWMLDHLSSDETRKRLVGVARNDAAPPDAYEDIVSRQVYERLGREAGREVAGGRSVIVDATFRRAKDAQAFVRSLRSAGALTAPVTLVCEASDDTLRARVHERAERGGSDAGDEVLAAQLSERRDTNTGISDGISLRTEGNVLDVAARAEQIVLEHTLPL
jgi:uncharacterized protein